MIKAILIDGYGQRIVQQHMRPSFHDVEEIIGPDWWTTKPHLLDNGDMIYWNGHHQCNSGEFTYQGTFWCGNVLISRIDSYGDLMDCRTDLADVRPCVVWK